MWNPLNIIPDLYVEMPKLRRFDDPELVSNANNSVMPKLRRFDEPILPELLRLRNFDEALFSDMPHITGIPLSRRNALNRAANEGMLQPQFSQLQLEPQLSQLQLEPQFSQLQLEPQFSQLQLEPQFSQLQLQLASSEEGECLPSKTLTRSRTLSLTHKQVSTTDQHTWSYKRETEVVQEREKICTYGDPNMALQLSIGQTKSTTVHREVAVPLTDIPPPIELPDSDDEETPD